jgi:NNP family nitrate/nitrite transporter-like MFS transporter
MVRPGEVASNSSAGSTRALVLATVAFLAAFYVWALFGPLAPTLQKTLGLSDAQLSLLVAIPVLLGSVLRVPMGALTHRYGARLVFPALLLFVTLPLIGLALFHSSFGTLIFFGLLLGFAGSSFAVGVPYVSRWTPRERQGLALGLYGMGMGGTVLTALTAPTLAQTFGVTACFLLGAVLMVVVGLLFWWLAREPAAARPVAGSLIAPFAVFTRSARAWALTLFYFLAFGGFVAMFLYLPKLLVGVHHLGVADAGARTAGFALVAVVCRPLGGYLSDRVGARQILGVVFGLGAALAAALTATYEQIVPLTICCLGLGALFGLGTGAVFKLVALEFPSEVGAVTGVVGAAGGLGGFFPPLVMAAVKGATGRYAFGFLLLALTSLLCLAVLWLLGRGRPREAEGAPRPEVLRG